VYEIDGLPPVAVYAKYFAQELANQLPQVGVEFPLVFQKNAVLIGRAALLRRNDGSLTFAGNVPEGAEVSFGLGSIEKILQNGNYHVGNMIDDMESSSARKIAINR
jgi:c-di-GMP phosphodiesterase